MSVAVAVLSFLLTFLTMLGVPLTGFLAGFGAALWLALAHVSPAWPVAGLGLGLLSEGLASHFGAKGRGSVAQAMSFVVLGRSLGPWLGSGLFLFAGDAGRLPAAAGMTALARAIRVLGIVAALGLLTVAMR